EAEQNGAQKVNHAGQSEERRQDADGNQRAAVQDDLTACTFTADVNRKTGAHVVFGENPGDRKKMWHLPQKENREERQRNGVHFPSRGRPTHDGWRRTWKCSDECTKRCTCLERRIDQNVSRQSRRSDESGQKVNEDNEIKNAGARNCSR